jgi:hypothetical protein
VQPCDQFRSQLLRKAHAKFGSMFFTVDKAVILALLAPMSSSK